MALLLVLALATVVAVALMICPWFPFVKSLAESHREWFPALLAGLVAGALPAFMGFVLGLAYMIVLGWNPFVSVIFTVTFGLTGLGMYVGRFLSIF